MVECLVADLCSCLKEYHLVVAASTPFRPAIQSRRNHGLEMLFSTAISLLLATGSIAQITLTGTNSISSTGADYPTGTEVSYASYRSESSRSDSTTYGTLFSDTTTMTSNATETASSNSTTSATRTLLVGGSASTTSTALNGTNIRNGTATSTSTSAAPTNTQPCNGHPAFCNRKFSNITYVAAHNSPFIKPGNAASNQMLPVTTQLEDGIRMRESDTRINEALLTGLQFSSRHTLSTGPSTSAIPPANFSTLAPSSPILQK